MRFLKIQIPTIILVVVVVLSFATSVSANDYRYDNPHIGEVQHPAEHNNNYNVHVKEGADNYDLYSNDNHANEYYQEYDNDDNNYPLYYYY